MRRLSAAVLLLLGCWPTFTVACGGASDRAATLHALSEDEFMAQLPAATCDGLEHCCTAAGHRYDRDHCYEYVIERVRNNFPQETRDRFSYDAEAAARCVESERQTAQSCQPLREQFPACAQVYTGNTQPGEPCQTSSECARPPGGAASCGLPFGQFCQITTRGRAGDPCSSTCTQDASGTGCSGRSRPDEVIIADCYTNDGLYCSIGRCQPLLAMGEVCDTDEGCGTRARCDGVCVPRAQEGEPCNITECDEGLYCDDTRMDGTRSCLPIKPPGAPCSINSSTLQCGHGFCNDGVCADHYPFPDADFCNGVE